MIAQVDDLQAENISINNEMRHFYNHGNPRSFDPAKMDMLAGQVASDRQHLDIRYVARVPANRLATPD